MLSYHDGPLWRFSQAQIAKLLTALESIGMCLNVMHMLLCSAGISHHCGGDGDGGVVLLLWSMDVVHRRHLLLGQVRLLARSLAVAH